MAGQRNLRVSIHIHPRGWFLLDGSLVGGSYWMGPSWVVLIGWIPRGWFLLDGSFEDAPQGKCAWITDGWRINGWVV